MAKSHFILHFSLKVRKIITDKRAEWNDNQACWISLLSSFDYLPITALIFTVQASRQHKIKNWYIPHVRMPSIIQPKWRMGHLPGEKPVGWGGRTSWQSFFTIRTDGLPLIQNIRRNLLVLHFWSKKHFTNQNISNICIPESSSVWLKYSVAKQVTPKALSGAIVHVPQLEWQLRISRLLVL